MTSFSKQTFSGNSEATGCSLGRFCFPTFWFCFPSSLLHSSRPPESRHCFSSQRWCGISLKIRIRIFAMFRNFVLFSSPLLHSKRPPEPKHNLSSWGGCGMTSQINQHRLRRKHKQRNKPSYAAFQPLSSGGRGACVGTCGLLRNHTSCWGWMINNTSRNARMERYRHNFLYSFASPNWRAQTSAMYTKVQPLF